MVHIISEVGINHNGNLDLAKKLVDTSKWAGADIVKFQTYFHYPIINPTLSQEIINSLPRYAFTKEEWIELKEYCDDIDIEFLTTPEINEFDTVDFVDDLVIRHKIASPSIVEKEFVKYVASKEKPMLISTGSIVHKNRMATIDEISEMLSWIPDSDITLLSCVSRYPYLDDEAHYERIDELKQFGYPVGLSDHSKNIFVPKGLPVYEKHFMLKGIDCIDEPVSMNQFEFKEMVKRLNE